MMHTGLGILFIRFAKTKTGVQHIGGRRRRRRRTYYNIVCLLQDTSGWFRLLNGHVGRQRHFAVQKQPDLHQSSIGKSFVPVNS